MEKGTLFIVATPIGNLQDVTLRAIQTLTSVSLIYSEQREKTSILLSKLMEEYPNLVTDKKPPIYSLNEFEEDQKIPEVVNHLLSGKSLAFVSEAGTPLISDPGFKLVRECFKRGIKVVPIPGVSSVITALSASPLPTDKFLFLGFSPKSSGKRIHSLEKILHSLQAMSEEGINPTVVLFESPHRIQEFLEDFHQVFANQELVIARELTKVYEEFIRGSAKELLSKPSIKNPKGEFVVLFSVAK